MDRGGAGLVGPISGKFGSGKNNKTWKASRVQNKDTVNRRIYLFVPYEVTKRETNTSV